MHNLCKMLRWVLERDGGVFIEDKDDWMPNKSEAIQEL